MLRAIGSSGRLTAAMSERAEAPPYVTQGADSRPGTRSNSSLYRLRPIQHPRRRFIHRGFSEVHIEKRFDRTPALASRAAPVLVAAQL